MIRSRVFLAGLIIILVLISGCKDHGIEPMGTSVYGTVVFEGEWPDNLNHAFVVLAKDRPPNDELDISYLVAFENIPFEEKPDAFDFEILPDESGLYNWLFVAAIGNIDSLDINNVISEYEDPDNPGEPGVVTIETTNFDAGTLYVNFDEVHIP